ncbi:ATP-binding protein [Antarctobacter heliothermus]|uniref:histidine kinase n=1 Tax=Antarctobacter heliothermus TaxID=74033 RepID=A0A239L4H6_9RHOB|nr:ATP-binding protein [Antarctobacter heliothermus]SNT24902.1 PAS domain S-box-containing protein [Antarctobacter heliothermus]
MSDQHPSDDDALYSRIGAGGHSHAVMLEQAARIAQLGYFVFNVKESIVEVCSVRHAAIFGQSPDDFIDSVSGLKGPMEMIHPEDRDLLREAYQRLLKGETIEMEYRFYRTDRSMGYIRETVAPDYDSSGQVVRGLGSSLDVTDTRRAEERKAQANRLAALGELTAGVAHDVNNILAVVMGNAELLQDDLQDPAPTQLLSEIVSAARRGGTLTQSLLNFAQRATIRPVPLDLGEEMAQAAGMFERTTLKKPVIEIDRGATELPIYADRDNLQSVILNILINARDAIRDGGSIRITCAAQQFDRPEDTGPPAPGSYACLTIQDDGAGIPPQYLARVTEPFFTTKSRSNGSGLGLSMAAGFMRQLGGEIVITSQPGAGTTVRLFFPLHLDVPAQTDTGAQGRPATFDRLHVLLLEDEDAIRTVLQRNLTRWGFTVTAASTGQEAMAAVETHRFDFALLDNYFPGDLSGVDIAAQVKARNPATPVILLTGMAHLDSGADRAVIDLVLAKPIAAQELRARIAALVETAHPPRSEPA